MQKYIAQLNEAQRTRIKKDGPMIIIVVPVQVKRVF
jgi:hypothetical protein